MKLVLRAFLACSVLSLPVPAANVWHVDAAAAPPGLGTPASPYTSIQYAIDQPTTHDLDTLLVAPGDYAGFGNHGKFLSLRSTRGAALTRIHGSLAIDGANVIEGFTLDGGDVFETDVRRCIVRGSGLRLADGNVVDHCTFVSCDHAISDWGFSGGGYWITHCIFWNCAVGVSTNAPGAMSYCAGQTGACCFGWTISNPVPGDPLLWDTAFGDVHLRPGSPCIDAGSPSLFDPDGSTSDIGVFPFDASYVPAAQAYCSSELNGDGCYALVDSSGTCSASSSAPFLLTCSGVPPDKLGRLLYSSGPAATPFQGGTLCLANPIRRTASTTSGSNGQPPPADQCSGVLQFDFNALVGSGVDPELVPGHMVCVQFRYRDPHDPLGYGVGWSNAVRFAIGP